MSLPRDLVELLSAFGDAGVRYLVIGGHAVSLHARPRSTKDLDIWFGDVRALERAGSSERKPSTTTSRTSTKAHRKQK